MFERNLINFYFDHKRFVWFVGLVGAMLFLAYWGCFEYMATVHGELSQTVMNLSYTRMEVYQVFLLCLLTVGLYENKSSYAQLGLQWDKWDGLRALKLLLVMLGYAFLFALGMVVVSYLTTGLMNGFSADPSDDFMKSMAHTNFGVMFLVTLVNPFFEETFIRGYFMTEFIHFTDKKFLAVFLSALLQAGYHLYQGVTPTLLHFITFYIFAAYYLKTRKLAPVVLAHLFLDLSAFVISYWRFH